FVVFDFLMPKPPPVLEEEVPAEVADRGDFPDAPRAEPVERDPAEQAEPEPSRDVEVVRHTVRNDLLSLELTNRSPARGGMICGIELLADQFQGHQTAVDALGIGDSRTLQIGFADE